MRQPPTLDGRKGTSVDAAGERQRHFIRVDGLQVQCVANIRAIEISF